MNEDSEAERMRILRLAEHIHIQATGLEGVWAEPLDCSILLERTGGTVHRVLLSPDLPARESIVAGAILGHLQGGPRPAAEPDLSGSSSFQRDVLEVVRKIDRGETLTYGDVARKVGRTGGSRAVGRALSGNPLPLLIPCHRVVSTRGLGGYIYGAGMKARILALERAKA